MSGKTTAVTKVGQIIQPPGKTFYLKITDSVQSSTWRISYMHSKKNYTNNPLQSVISVRREIWGGWVGGGSVMGWGGGKRRGEYEEGREGVRKEGLRRESVRRKSARRESVKMEGVRRESVKKECEGEV